MNRWQAKKLIRETFESPFDREKFIHFIKEFLNHIEESPFNYQGQYIPDTYKKYINRYERIGKYSDGENRIDILIVHLKRGTSIERARSMQRNFIAGYLKGNYGSSNLKDAALVAFVSPDKEDWRFSLVKMEYRWEKTPTGRVRIKEEFTPARRWSFLVGKNEKSHTAQSRLIPILEDDEHDPTLKQIEEAFNIEPVTKEFFDKYRDLLIRTVEELDKIVKRDAKVREEFGSKNINTVDFAKKLLGQIVFLYFLQKKGWFGVSQDKRWGEGDKNFLRNLFEECKREKGNFFNDYLEQLFYNTLNNPRTDQADPTWSKYFNCKIPFLNGGLFEPIGGYDWLRVDIPLPNKLFSNTKKTPEGDTGDGILDVFDRFNFTVKEDEPLEKEVAIDPELLGKLYEKFNAIRPDNFYEYKKAVKSGKRSLEKRFNKKFGVYYTPREIVHYMCQESLTYYLAEELKGKVSKEDIEKLIKYGEEFLENEATYEAKKEKIERGEQKKTTYTPKLPDSVKKYAKEIDEALKKIRICDPAVGSGAFPVGVMHEIVKIRRVLSEFIKDSERSVYDFKRECIENSLYGVDIDSGAVEVAKLRLWLSLIVDEENIEKIKPLPNLDYKIVCGNSLLGIKEDLFNNELFRELERLKPLYFNETKPAKKREYKRKIEELIDKITNGRKQFDFKVYFSEVFHEKGGFDVVIANPPYVSTKGRQEASKKELEEAYGFVDDLYNHFYFKGIEILKELGVLTFISSKTYWTIQTKGNLRDLLFENRIIEIFDVGNPFEAMVDTAVIIVQKKQDNSNYIIGFKDGRRSLNKPQEYQVGVDSYRQSPNRVIFIPTAFNVRIIEKYGKIVKELMDEWWNKIKTSRDIEKNKRELEIYRNSLKPGDVTLLGLITEGGQGLATGNNGKYIGVLEGTKYADRVWKTRPEKLTLAVRVYNIKKLKFIKDKQDAEMFLADLSEYEIRELFDDLKEKYGRDIFGQGYLYRIVSPDEIADVDSLTDDEKMNGISGNRTFVPYEKGDKEGNRWYAPTPYYIDWSRENVKFLKEHSGKKGIGMPVVRNPQFYFREGFCWSDIHTILIKARLKSKGVHDVKSMSLFPLLSEICPAFYLVSILNSSFISEYDFNFVNNTQTFQINDARQIPIIIPTMSQLSQFERVFNKAYTIQKMRFEGKLTKEEADEKLNKIQKEVDEMVYDLYGVNLI